MASLNRRSFLRLGAGTALSATGLAVAQGPQGCSGRQGIAPRTSDSLPSVHRFRLGALEVNLVNDGRVELPAEVFAPEVEEEERERYFAARHLPVNAVPLQLCPLLIDTGTRRILVDTGMGPPPEVAPDSGWLTREFSVTGTTAEAIDVIVLTHGHADHYGGLMDPATGKSRFSNAEVVIARAELDFWTDPNVTSQNPGMAESYGGMEEFEAYVAMTAGVLNAVGERLRPIEPGQEIAPGIHSVDSAGHTAGHIGILAESEGQQLLIVGDAITNIHIAFEHPRWRFLYDDDGEQAIRTRVQLLERAASEGLLISGYHFPFPAVGRVFRDGDAYRWLPDAVG